MNKLKFSLDTSSVKQVCSNLKASETRVKRAGNKAVKKSAKRIFQTAQLYVPVQTGALAASGKISNASAGNRIRNIISYGDSTVNTITGEATKDYAVDRHEIVNPAKPASYKWLERTVRNSSTIFMEELQLNLKDSI